MGLSPRVSSQPRKGQNHQSELSFWNAFCLLYVIAATVKLLLFRMSEHLLFILLARAREFRRHVTDGMAESTGPHPSRHAGWHAAPPSPACAGEGH